MPFTTSGGSRGALGEGEVLCHQCLEEPVRTLHPLDRDGAGGEDLDQGQPRRLGAAGDLAGKGEKPEPKPLAPLLLTLGGGEDPAHRGADDDVVGGEETLFLAGEMFVEISLRDAGVVGQRRHGEGVVAVLGDELDHRLLQPAALVRGDVLAESPGPGCSFG